MTVVFLQGDHFRGGFSAGRFLSSRALGMAPAFYLALLLQVRWAVGKGRRVSLIRKTDGLL
jgi:hypothetical protein